MSVIVVIALVVAVLVWLLFIRGDDNSNSGGALGGPQVSKNVEVVKASGLANAVAGVGYPVYWIGDRPGVGYELTRISDGRTYIRYLPTGEPAESETPYLTVGSYAQQDAYKVLKRLAARSGAEIVETPGGGVALVRSDKPDGVYVAFPGADTQIEVYDPEPGRALDLVKSGAVTPVG